VLQVDDAGPGIPPADRERVFDRFYRATAARSRPGSGLGLAIVADVVARHGGRVWARNRDGGGAVVGFSLPGPDADALTEPSP
jgi:two-component system sensor histidine kinase MprB